MKTITACTIAAVFGSLAAAPAFADHMSPMGAGTANMPNDIHNTRIDTRLAEDYQSFIDFVRYGMGADSVNRYLTDTTTTAGQAASGTSRAAMSGSSLTSGTSTGSAIDTRMGGRR